MKRLVIVILLGFALCGNVDKYMGFCLLIPKNVEIPIYDYSDHKIISDYIINDTLKDDYPILTIDSIKDSMAFVHVEYPMGSRKDCKGWILMKYLGVYINAPGDSLKIYRAPNYDEVAFEIKDVYWGTSYPVIDASEGWLKIVIPDDSGKTGWVPPEYQSQNPYTPSC